MQRNIFIALCFYCILALVYYKPFILKGFYDIFNHKIKKQAQTIFH